MGYILLPSPISFHFGFQKLAKKQLYGHVRGNLHFDWSSGDVGCCQSANFKALRSDTVRTECENRHFSKKKKICFNVSATRVASKPVFVQAAVLFSYNGITRTMQNFVSEAVAKMVRSQKRKMCDKY